LHLILVGRAQYRHWASGRIKRLRPWSKLPTACLHTGSSRAPLLLPCGSSLAAPKAGSSVRLAGGVFHGVRQAKSAEQSRRLLDGCFMHSLAPKCVKLQWTATEVRDVSQIIIHALPAVHTKLRLGVHSIPEMFPALVVVQTLSCQVLLRSSKLALSAAFLLTALRRGGRDRRLEPSCAKQPLGVDEPNETTCRLTASCAACRRGSRFRRESAFNVDTQSTCLCSRTGVIVCRSPRGAYHLPQRR
jgi:hypothetical protein